MVQLLIGPRLNRDKKTIGGSEVLFENWIKYCEDNSHEVIVIDANKHNYRNRIAAIISILWQIIRLCRKCDLVFLHGSRNDYFYIAPYVTLISKLYHKPFFLKKFAGYFDKDYNSALALKKIGIRWSMRNATGLYWETQNLLTFGKQFNVNSKWVPNTRYKTPYQRDISSGFDKKKIVFMSHVRKEKGIDELMEALKSLGDEYRVDIYGTLMGYEPEELGGCYCGVVPSDKVPEVLSQYSLLLLPTWFEGYPGIIIEAFGCGVPVVASRVGGIPEMIEDGVNGLMCEAHDSKSLVDTIRRIDDLDYMQLSKSALKSFDKYNAEIVNKSIINDLERSITR